MDTPHPVKVRSIPACAGEPVISYHVPARSTVYPRVCGGTKTSTQSWLITQGLSPRVRGNRAGVEQEAGGEGSIPACAGEPFADGGNSDLMKVYPRVCGGTAYKKRWQECTKGLSPRVRGNLLPAFPLLIWIWSIPACAGEPSQPASERYCYQVYPRVCGGTIAGPAGVVAAWGLSPRVRGNHADRRKGAAERRSIPACAGEPVCSSARPF